MNETPRKEEKKDIVGIHILRVVLCFAVIMNHFWEDTSNHLYEIPLCNLMRCAAPAFMFVSFLFTEKLLFNPSFAAIRKRIIRLVWPFAVWGIVSWCVVFFAGLILKTKIADGFHALFWQLATGHGYHVNAPLWYLALSIWITLLYCLLFHLLKKKAAIAIHVLAVFCIVSQYTGWNYALFNNLPFELKYPLGRIAEMIPYATLGYDVAYARSHFEFSRRQVTFLLIVSLVVALVFLGTKHSTLARGFEYSGLFLLAGATCFATVFYLLPLQWLPDSKKQIIVFFCSHTLGIYCMHYPVGNILKSLLEKFHINLNSLLLCVFIYALCFCLSSFLSFFHYKALKELVD